MRKTSKQRQRMTDLKRSQILTPMYARALKQTLNSALGTRRRKRKKEAREREAEYIKAFKPVFAGQIWLFCAMIIPNLNVISLHLSRKPIF